MPLFDADNRLRSDLCAVNKRDAQNLSMEEYVFRDVRKMSPTSCPAELSPADCAELGARLQSSDGYGIASKGIDSDSDLRFSMFTHDRTRQDLPSRMFKAAPDMGRGGLDATVESRLLLSGDLGTSRVCTHRFAELSYNRFDPVVQSVPVSNIVQPFPAGQPSRQDESLRTRHRQQ